MVCKKIISMILTATLVFSLVSFSGISEYGAQSSSASVLERYDQLEEEYLELRDELNSLRDQKNVTQSYVDMIYSQIDTIEQQIDILDERMVQLSEDVNQMNLENETLNREISQLQTEVDSNWDLLKTRLRAMYMSGETSTFELLLSAESLSDFLAKSELLRSVVQHDADLINGLESDLKSLEEKQAQIQDNLAKIEQTQQELNTSKADYDAKQIDLEAQWERSNELVEALNEDEENTRSRVAKEEEELLALNKELEEVYGIVRPNPIPPEGSEADDGTMMWPLPGYGTITSGYGQRWGKLHSAIDISGGGVYGKPIVAARSGEVIKVHSSSSGSYGKYLIIYHGDGVSTLYAHCSSIVVSEGDYVTKGQTIAKVGSTGNSTGPHLHFEVRIDGNAVNPTNYVSFN